MTEAVMHGNTPTDQRAEQIGKVVSTIFIAAMIALFAYGYLVPMLRG
jgi:hypothetical protein